ncbi:OmpA family protein [Poseidonibacter ostreae]|jgi:chemotaxis protein MotB|nr:OmpA family protein [Poseidonibacter ostreae]
MYDKKQSNEENFWISYADLMAGLLFVFILVIGAIIIKYLYAQTDLKAIKTNLEEQKEALNLSEEELLNKKKKLTSVNSQLKKIQEEKVHLSFELVKSKNMFNETKLQLEEEKILAQKLSKELETKNKNLELSIEQIEKITAILEDKENSIKLLNQNLEDEKNALLAKEEQINFNIEEIEKLKALLFDYELKEKEQNDIKEELSTKVKNQENIISLKDEELLMLEEKILTQSKIHQKLVEEFDITKVKIKHLTGIKINVISKLREKLGKSINIDEKSGAITFSSNILFDQGKYTLKEESKQELSVILKKYLQALLDDENIRKYIHSITIEGHTNSDGSYLDNLALSQQRALEVMQFLYTSKIADKTLLEKYVNASGRSYSDIIYKDGVEDKDNSRRIEIKFRIKNEAAIKELQNFLGDKK